MAEVLRQIIARNRAGEPAAIPSVCSAHPDVLRASLALAQELDRPIVIEATSNQVNQDGGYTGMTPADFIALVHGAAGETGTDRARITFGGDHLGPQAWRRMPAEAAMAKAHEMVAGYVAAGFEKIHLDCSEGCAGEPAQLDDAQTAARSAALAERCLQVHEDVMFVIGTEVPPPGGARLTDAGDVQATTPAAAAATLEAHAATFGDRMALVGGLVVQPGVEFAPMAVHYLPMDRDPGLRAALAGWPGLCLEAHSTDYQKAAVYPRLAELGFAFQKVGPALTFAYRQAIYALDRVLVIMGGTGHVPQAMEQVMTTDPQHWAAHYPDDPVARHYGLADRIRYYWPAPVARQAVQALLDDLPTAPPDPVLWQVFGADVLDHAEGKSGPWFARLIEAQIQAALRPYFFDEGSRLT